MSIHINAPKGAIAESILLPGDPLRAKYIAETFLQEPKLYNEVRGMLGYTGLYKGVPVSGNRNGDAFHGHIFMGAYDGIWCTKPHPHRNCRLFS